MRMYALYTNNGAPVAGLTLGQVVFTVKAIKRSDNSITTPVSAQAATLEAGGGYYLYDYAAANFETYDYVWFAQYTGATSVDAAYVFGNTDAVAEVDDLSGFTVAGKAEVQQEVDDALVAYAAAKTSDLSDMAKDSTVVKIIGSGTLTTSSVTVPADAGRLEVDNYWRGCLLVTTVGAVANQPRLIRSFSAGVFTLDAPFTTLPGLSAYKIMAFQKDATVAQTGEAATYSSIGEAQTWSAKGEAATALTGYDGGKGVAKDDTVAKELTLTTLAGIFPLDPASESAVESAITAASSQGEAATFSAQGEAATALADWVSSYAAPLLRILGLVQENQIIDTTVFDTDGHMTSARLRTFTDATLTIVLATYTTTATYDVSGNMTNFQVVKV